MRAGRLILAMRQDATALRCFLAQGYATPRVVKRRVGQAHVTPTEGALPGGKTSLLIIPNVPNRAVRCIELDSPSTGR
jgi:hypothetical protein